MDTTARALLVAALLGLVACGGQRAEDLTGAELASEVGCLACHTEADSDIAPTLNGLWGSEVLLDDGRTLTADEAYVRRSITEPDSDIVAGFDDRMPTFSLSESEVERLVDYVRSLG